MEKKAVINSVMSAQINAVGKIIFEIERPSCLRQIEELHIRLSYRRKKCIISLTLLSFQKTNIK